MSFITPPEGWDTPAQPAPPPSSIASSQIPAAPQFAYYAAPTQVTVVQQVAPYQPLGLIIFGTMIFFVLFLFFWPILIPLCFLLAIVLIPLLLIAFVIWLIVR